MKGNSMAALDALRRLDAAMITPAQAAPVLGCDPHTIRLQAEREPQMLGFPVTRMGRRTLIPRLAFIAFIEGGRAETEVQAG